MLLAIRRITSFTADQLPKLMATLLDIEQVLSKQLDDVNIRDGSLITALFADGSVTQAKDAANTRDATIAANVADNAATAGLTLIYSIAVPAGTTGNIDVTVTHKVRVYDVSLVKRSAAGGGAGTITVGNGANPITDAISINIADKTVAVAATIDDAYRDIAAGGTLRVTRTRTASTDEMCDVYVHCYRIA